MKQEIWTPPRNTILQFLIDKQNAGYRFVAVSPHIKTRYDAHGIGHDELTGYIVIGEKEDQ